MGTFKRSLHKRIYKRVAKARAQKGITLKRSNWLLIISIYRQKARAQLMKNLHYIYLIGKNC